MILLISIISPKGNNKITIDLPIEIAIVPLNFLRKFLPKITIVLPIEITIDLPIEIAIVFPIETAIDLPKITIDLHNFFTKLMKRSRLNSFRVVNSRLINSRYWRNSL